ncbi:MAG: hypothetical protein IJI10_02575 [Eubacterium sp.]|nr:hypothetical protein [Eubacterium sp.]
MGDAESNPFRISDTEKPEVDPFQIGNADKPAVWTPKLPGTDEDDVLPDAGVLEEPETVTLMIYMVGSDLESSGSAATDDMAEIAASGIDPSCTNVLIYAGGSTDWHSDVPSDANTLFHLEQGRWTELETYEQTSMGDPANLARFLQYGYENYPADAYDLILWDHGSGPVIGYGSDTVFGGDGLTLPEMKEALEASPFGTGGDDAAGNNASAESGVPEKAGKKLSIIGFDACLMASAELACTVSDYADYLIASQETEPSFGWNYQFLKDVGHKSSDVLAAEVVEQYISFCEDYFQDKEFFQSDVTLAALDLGYTEKLAEAIDALFAAAQDDVSGDFNKLAVARVHTHGLGRASTGSEYDLVDMESMLQEMSQRYPKEAQAALHALDDCVLYSKANVDGCCGLSLFYPYYNKNYYMAAWKDEYAKMGFFPHYHSYLERYEKIWLGTDLKEAFTEKMQPVKGDRPSVYQMQLTPEQEEQFASAAYYILQRRGEELYAPVFMSTNVTDKNGLLTAEFGGKAIYVSDEYGSRHIPVTRMWDTTEGVTEYSVLNMQASRGDFLADEDSDEKYEICNATGTIAVNEETGELTVKGIYENEDDESGISGGKKQPLNLDEWEWLRFYNVRERYLTRDDAGRIINFWEWPEGDWITGNELAVANGIHFYYESMYDDGMEYYIMFDVQDVQGNHYESELLPVTLEKAPVEAAGTNEQIQTIRWEKGSESAILEEAGVKADVRIAEDPAGGKDFYMISAVNENEYPVRLQIGDLYVNNTLSVNGSVYMTLEPGEKGYEAIPDISNMCRLAGIDAVEKLAFRMELRREDNSAYLIYDRPVELQIADQVQAETVLMPALGALAERQVLTETNDVRVTLLDFGQYLTPNEDPDGEYADANLVLCMENLSKEEKEVCAWGVEIDGVFFRNDADNKIAPGGKWYKSLSIPFKRIRGAVENSFEERPERIASIGSMRVLTVLGGEIVWCPVELSQRGEQDTVNPDAFGDVLFENEQMQIRLYNTAADPETEEADSSDFAYTYADDALSSLCWDLWLINKTDDVIMMDILEEGEEAPNYTAVGKIGPGSAELVEAKKYLNAEEPDPSGYDVFAEIKEISREGYTETELFVLPADRAVRG